MQQTVGTVEGTLQLTRKVYGMLLAAMIACLLAVEGLFRPAVRSLDHVLYESIAIVAFLCAGSSFAVRYRMLRPTFEALRENPVDADALKRWRSGSLISYILALSVFFFGCRLRLMGATFAQAAPFYGVGLALLLLWWPRRPE